MGSGRNKTLNAHPRSLDQCLDTVYSSNQSILSVLHFWNDCFLEERLKINWLEQSEEDPLVCNEGNFDDQNSPKCIMDRVSGEAEQFILRRNEERRVKNLANGLLDNESDESDDESQEEENLAEVEDEEASSRIRFQAGRSRSGRRVTRYLL